MNTNYFFQILHCRGYYSPQGLSQGPGMLFWLQTCGLHMNPQRLSILVSRDAAPYPP